MMLTVLTCLTTCARLRIGHSKANPSSAAATANQGLARVNSMKSLAWMRPSATQPGASSKATERPNATSAASSRSTTRTRATALAVAEPSGQQHGHAGKFGSR